MVKIPRSIFLLLYSRNNREACCSETRNPQTSVHDIMLAEDRSEKLKAHIILETDYLDIGCNEEKANLAAHGQRSVPLTYSVQ